MLAFRSQNMKQKITEWIKRYGLAELNSLVLTVSSAWLSFRYTENHLTSALVGTWAGNIAYFGTILLQDIRLATKQLALLNKPYSLATFSKNVRALLIEFGIAELLDSLFIRPTLLYYFPLWLNNFGLGIVIAKFTADISFYIPAIIGYELSKKRLRRFE